MLANKSVEKMLNRRVHMILDYCFTIFKIG